MRLVINDIPKSPNGSQGLLRMHWAARGKYNQYWKLLIRSQFRSLPEDPPDTKKKVSISQMRRRLLDRDNLYASCKPILDAMTRCNLIRDDSEEWIELHVTQVTGKQKITVIEVEDAR